MGETGDPGDSRLRSARALRELALAFADRAQASEAALLAAFSGQAASLAAATGPVVISSDDDEHLLLRADGVVAGEVLDDDTGDWLAIERPDEVARYYDPTDVFLDLADALDEAYPGLADESAGIAEHDVPPPATAATSVAAGDGDGVTTQDADAASGERATAQMLEDLRRAGVLSDAEFERLKADLGR